MAKLSHKNLNQSSPSWLVNVTAVLVTLATVGPELVDKMPGSVSDVTKEWLQWVLGAIAMVFSITTALSKNSRPITFSSSPDDADGPGGTDPNKPRGPK